MECSLKNILIIERSETIKAVIGRILKNAGFACRTFSDLNNAMDVIEGKSNECLSFAAMIIDEAGFKLFSDKYKQYSKLSVLILVDKLDDENLPEKISNARNYDILLKDSLMLLPLRLKKLIDYQDICLDIRQFSSSKNKNDELIVLVDDSPTICAKYGHLLKESGYKIITANSMGQALNVIHETHPTLVISDYYMPDGNGDELCEKLVNNPETSYIPVVMFSQRKDVIEKALTVGAIDLLYKDDPINIFKMRVDAIMQVIQSQRSIHRLDVLIAATQCFGIGVLVKVSGSLMSYNKQMELFANECGSPELFDIKDKDEAIVEFPDKCSNQRAFQIIRMNFRENEDMILVMDITIRKKAQDELEQKVKERTVDLIAANEALKNEIITRKQIEQELKTTMDKLKTTHLQMIKTEKMSALGVMTAGVAHELNNPLMGILNYIQYCIKHSSAENKTFQILKDSEFEIFRCIKIVENLLTFSRSETPNEEQFKEESLTLILDRVLRLMSYRIDKENVKVHVDIDNDIPKAWVKVSNMQQVFLNLFSNALDALSGRETKEINITMSYDQHCIKISFSDTGCGILPENIPKIFDPFFTTKPVGKGTGLGLALCISIIETHGGEISCDSKPDMGSTFHILLPNK